MKLGELIPTCVGDWERGDDTCNGDPEAFDEDREPCAWRERCIGFQLHMSATGETKAVRLNVIQLSGRMAERSGFRETSIPNSGTVAEFARMCRHSFQTRASARQKRDTQLRPPAPVSPPVETETGAKPRPKQRRRRTEAERREVHQHRREEFAHYHGLFQEHLAKVLHPRKIKLRAKSFILPGDLLITSRLPHKYIGELYVRERSSDRTLVRWQLMGDTMRAKVFLAVQLMRVAAELSRRDFDNMAPTANASRSLMCKIPQIKFDQVPAVSRLVGKLNRKGYLL